jgi:uncharacterized Zn finger protein (UPF0148 family)
MQDLSPEARAEAAGVTLISENEAREEINKRMLEGWTMLNESCPITGLPLIGKDGIKYSARLQLEVLTPGAARDKNLTMSPDRAKPPSPVGSEDSYDMITDAPEVQSRMADLNDQSARIGELLLKGWRMCEQVDPLAGCPLMEEPSTKRLFSVARGEFMGVPADFPPKPKPETVKPPQPEPVKPQRGCEGTKTLSSDEQSAKMGELLLQGWTMLEEVCPVTGQCPLMQQKNSQRTFSVALDSFLDDLEKTRFADLEEPVDEVDHHTGLTESDTEEMDLNTKYAQAREELLSHTIVNSETSKPQSALSAPPPPAPAPPAPPSPGAGAEVRTEREMSNEIGELLLQGWELLNEPCPWTGKVDLLRAPGGRKYSVATGKYVEECPKYVEECPVPQNTSSASENKPQELLQTPAHCNLALEGLQQRSIVAIAAKMSAAVDELPTLSALPSKQTVELIEACSLALKNMTQ